MESTRPLFTIVYALLELSSVFLWVRAAISRLQ